MPDHATPVAIKTHSSDPVPFAVLSSHDDMRDAAAVGYNEPCAKATNVLVSEAWNLMEHVIRGEVQALV